jgi:hypothetical protein
VIYALNKRFEIHYSNFKSIPTNFSGRKEAKILRRRLYSLNNNVSKWTFCNDQIAAASYISPYHNYLTVIKAYLVHEYFNRVETQMVQCIDIKNLCVTTQRLVQECVDEKYIPYVPDLREMELYPRYLRHEQRINDNSNLSEEAIDSLKIMSNSLSTKYQIGNVFECAKNMKELIELQVILNNRYTGYHRLI